MADALGPQRRIDDVDRFALRDRPVRAHRLADVAVDAELVDLQRHARIVSAGRRGTVPPPEKAVRIRAGSASAGGRRPGPTGPASPGRGPCTAPPFDHGTGVAPAGGRVRGLTWPRRTRSRRPPVRPPP